MSTTTTQQCDQATAIINGLERTTDGFQLPPKTSNRAKLAHSSKTAGWGWTHFFLLTDGRVVGRKLPDNLTFIQNWARREYGTDTFHLGRAVPFADRPGFRFEEWAFPV